MMHIFLHISISYVLFSIFIGTFCCIMYIFLHTFIFLISISIFLYISGATVSSTICHLGSIKYSLFLILLQQSV